MEDGEDPWWWSSKSLLGNVPASDPEVAIRPEVVIGKTPPMQSIQAPLQPGEVVYKYGLSRDMTMEPIQVVIEGFETFQRNTQCEQLSVTVQLLGSMGEPLSAAIVGTGCSLGEGSINRVRWSEQLLLPFKISDVPEDAALSFMIWGPPMDSFNQAPTCVGVTKFPLFSREGRLRTGKQELEVYERNLFTVADWTPEKHEQEMQRIWCRTTVDFEREEAQLLVASKMKNHWLNRIAETRLREVRRSRRLQINEQVVGVLAIELPDFAIPIIYEPEDEEQQLVVVNDTGHRAMEDPESRTVPGGEVIFPEMYFMLRNETFRNVVESKCYAMRRSLTRKSAGDDPLLRPNVDERAKIERILNSLSKPTSEDEDLLWKFRHSLVRNSKALTKVLASVKWDNEDEVIQASKLLAKWESAEVCDVLTLLSGELEFSHPVVRSYAVKVLSATGDAVLQLYMPQLIQALRYDIVMVPPASAADVANSEPIKQAGPLQRFLVEKCSSNEDLASCLHWYLKVECALAKTSANPAAQDIFFPVAEAFREAVSRHPVVARAVQAQDEFVSRIMAAARTAASVSGRQMEKTRVLLAALDQESNKTLVEPIPLAGFPGKRIVRIKTDSARIMKSTTSPAVIEFVIQSTNAPSSVEMSRYGHVGASQHLHPHHHQQQQHSGTASSHDQQGHGMGESVASVRSQGTASSQTTKPAPHPASEPSTMRVIFKVGDDLRQDQLIIQLIELMDSIFRENGLDLEMTIYHVLATAPLEGLIEFVPDAMPLSKVMNDYGSILAYLKREEHLHGGRKVVVDRFIRSSAGYAVATYVLGIGDRHLDNIMLRPNGHMFHIDFGYAFGRDPKLFSVLVRVSPQMIEAMGVEGEKAFRRHCWEALKALRGQAALILSVIGLMVDASIPDLSKLQMPSNVLAGVQERLKLGFSDEEAERSFNAVIDQSIGALGPRLNERIHQFAQQWI